MRSRSLLFGVVALLLIFSFSPASHAYLCRVIVDGCTTNYTDDTQLNIAVIPTDTTNQNPPDIISSITVTAPDGTVFTMNTDQNWLAYDRIYWGTYRADDFNFKRIPSGTYQVRVTAPVYNLEITETDVIDASVLAPPAITSPTDGATVNKDHVFWWTAVSGATYYRIWLWNESWNEPVYWCWENQFKTNHNGAQIPNGYLKPGFQYRMRIEARAGGQDLDKRSRSDWITFTVSN